jgi:hypothetical protein
VDQGVLRGRPYAGGPSPSAYGLGALDEGVVEESEDGAQGGAFQGMLGPQEDLPGRLHDGGGCLFGTGRVSVGQFVPESIARGDGQGVRHAGLVGYLYQRLPARVGFEAGEGPIHQAVLGYRVGERSRTLDASRSRSVMMTSAMAVRGRGRPVALATRRKGSRPCRREVRA